MFHNLIHFITPLVTMVGRPIRGKVTLELFNKNELVDHTLDLVEEIERLEPKILSALEAG